MEDRRTPETNRMTREFRSSSSFGLVIVLASLAISLVVLASGCKPGSRSSAPGSPAQAVDEYMRGFRDLDATSTLDASSASLRSSMPQLPEVMLESMIKNAERFGRVRSWKVLTSDVDEPNAQAFLKVQVETAKVIYLMRFELRREQGAWKVAQTTQTDAVRNPSYGAQLPQDVGRANPFRGRSW